MKGMILIGLLLFSACTSYAQPMLYSNTVREALMRQHNKMYYITSLTDSVTVSNGVVIYADGSIRDATGKVYMMADGDCVKFNGKLVIFYEWIKTVDGIKTKRHCVRVWSILTKPVKLQNGTIAMPDGTLKLTTGNEVKMLNKDFMGFEGTETSALQ